MRKISWFLGALTALFATAGVPSAQAACCVGVSALTGLNAPFGMAIDFARDRLYIVDSGTNSVKTYTPEGIPIGSFGTAELNQPQDVAVDTHGNIYVVDFADAIVRKYNFQQTYLGTIGVPSQGNTRGLYVEDHGSTQSVYISTYPGYVHQYDGSGTTYSESASFGGGNLNAPTGVTKVGKWLYVADTVNYQIVKFDATVNDSQAITVRTGLINPMMIQTDLAGYFYVAEYGTSYIDIFSPDFSTLVNQCQPPGGSVGVVVNALGQYFVSGYLGNSVTIMQGCITEPTPTPVYIGNNPPAPGECFVYPSPAKGDHASVSYPMAEAGKVELRVWNEKGEMVTQVTDTKPVGVQVSPFSIAGFGTGVYFYALTLHYDSGREEKLGPKKFVVLH